MEPFTTETINLSLLNPETGNPITANIYRVEGIARDLSIGELVMAICLNQATELEESIISRMEAMGRMTITLESLTALQEALVDATADKMKTAGEIQPFKDKTSLRNLQFDLGDGVLDTVDFSNASVGEIATYLSSKLGIDKLSTTQSPQEFVQTISSKMDSLNAVNQKDMIELQSETTKRDQRYDLITNMLKSLHTVLSANANNIGR